MARQRVPVRQSRRKLDPLFGWLATDGYGFYLGLFHDERKPDFEVSIPRVAMNATCFIRDMVLLFGFWCADRFKTIAVAIAEARADLWSRIGLACVYAGTLDRRSLSELVSLLMIFNPIWRKARPLGPRRESCRAI